MNIQGAAEHPEIPHGVQLLPLRSNFFMRPANIILWGNEIDSLLTTIRDLNRVAVISNVALFTPRSFDTLRFCYIQSYSAL